MDNKVTLNADNFKIIIQNCLYLSVISIIFNIHIITLYFSKRQFFLQMRF